MAAERQPGTSTIRRSAEATIKPEDAATVPYQVAVMSGDTGAVLQLNQGSDTQKPPLIIGLADWRAIVRAADECISAVEGSPSRKRKAKGS